MNGSQGRQLIYLLLTISGTVLTQWANWQFIQENGGFALGEFIAQAGATAAGQSLSWDLVIGATAGVMAMIVEGLADEASALACTGLDADCVRRRCSAVSVDARAPPTATGRRQWLGQGRHRI